MQKEEKEEGGPLGLVIGLTALFAVVGVLAAFDIYVLHPGIAELFRLFR